MNEQEQYDKNKLSRLRELSINIASCHGTRCDDAQTLVNEAEIIFDFLAEGLIRFEETELPENANNSIEPHKCSFCGVLTTQDDKYCYKNPNGISMHNEPANGIETNAAQSV